MEHLVVRRAADRKISEWPAGQVGLQKAKKFVNSDAGVAGCLIQSGSLRGRLGELRKILIEDVPSAPAMKTLSS